MPIVIEIDEVGGVPRVREYHRTDTKVVGAVKRGLMGLNVKAAGK